MKRPGIPTYRDLTIPSIRAVAELGGSASAKEVREHVLDNVDGGDELLAIAYDDRPESSVLVDRADWGRSCAKLIGALESPTRGMFLLTELGKELLAADEIDSDAARQRVSELDQDYRRNKRKQDALTRAKDTADPAKNETSDDTDPVVFDEDESASLVPDARWPESLLRRLHGLTPTGFEKFVLYLLRQYGLELRGTGGSGDEGIDGIGTAPISPVLSSRVAVQVKRYNPNGKPIGRDVVALFQRDAQTKGAERAILVTLGRYTEAARKAATMTAPTVDLIDGERVAELVLAKELGVHLAPRVDAGWFDRFDG